MHNLNQKGRSRKRIVLFPAFRSIHSSVIETLFEILALRWLSRSDLLFVPRVALVPRGAWSFVSFQRVALEISAGSRRCCVMSLGKPTRYRRLSFFVESGRCWAACWSCNYGFEELLSMVISACDVKARRDEAEAPEQVEKRSKKREGREWFSNWCPVLNSRILARPRRLNQSDGPCGAEPRPARFLWPCLRYLIFNLSRERYPYRPLSVL